MADSGIGTYVRSWLHYGNLASSFYKQYGASRKIKDDFEKQIITTLQQQGMENAIIQINRGKIQVTTKREPNPLSLSKIEELLHGYFRHRCLKDETLDIMTFIRANRGYTLHKTLKQSGLPAQKEIEVSPPTL